MIRGLPVALVTRLSRKTLSTYQYIKFNNIASAMSNHNKNGVSLCKVLDAIRSFADPSLADSWDNVGLLVEPTEAKHIDRIMLTNDLTEDVMQEALDYKMDMIISYHPPIFEPLKSVTNKTWKERIIAKCLENKIVMYSPHTSFDSIKGGVGDWLASAFDLKTSEPIQPSGDGVNGMGRLCTLKNPIQIEDAVSYVKRLTKLDYVRLARARNGKAIKTVALCPGSGTSVLKKVSADLYLTGEMFHHDVLDAIHRDTHVILTNHSDSERGFLKEFAIILKEKLNDQVFIRTSESDADPLKTV